MPQSIFSRSFNARKLMPKVIRDSGPIQLIRHINRAPWHLPRGILVAFCPGGRCRRVQRVKRNPENDPQPEKGRFDIPATTGNNELTPYFCGERSSGVEHLTVAQRVVGSNPIAHPIYFYSPTAEHR